MQIKRPFSIEELEKAFPSKLPSNLLLTDSYGDAITETEAFKGITWREVKCDMFKKYFDVPSFFSPEAMHYFLPAFIWCSLTNLDEIDTALDGLLFIMSWTQNPNWMEWRKARWCRLTNEQWEVTQKWLEWLQTLPTASNLRDLSSAYNAVSSGIWR
jgi:hypothetical protein